MDKQLENFLDNKDIIHLVYKAEESVIDKIIIKANKDIKGELKSINTSKAIEDSNSPSELKEMFNKIEDNYNIRITKYNEEMYKKGFIDGVNLMLNCLNKNKRL